MDALWQGAIVPIPSILAVLRQALARVFGPGETVSAAVVARLPLLSPSTLPPGCRPFLCRGGGDARRTSRLSAEDCPPGQAHFLSWWQGPRQRTEVRRMTFVTQNLLKYLLNSGKFNNFASKIAQKLAEAAFTGLKPYRRNA
jgi:hypothetical protein